MARVFNAAARIAVMVFATSDLVPSLGQSFGIRCRIKVRATDGFEAGGNSSGDKLRVSRKKDNLFTY
jgi:hypothetical protein